MILRLLRWAIIAIDTHRGRIKVSIALLQPKAPIRTHGTGREPLACARVIEPVQDPAHRVIVERLSRDGLTSEPCRIMRRKEVVPAG